MSKLGSWLSATEVPRWQIALGFLLATLITISATYVTGRWTAVRQENAVQITKFRMSSGQLDSSANDLVNKIAGSRDAESAVEEFQHAVILNLRDLEAIDSIVDQPDLSEHYRSAIVAARVDADEIHSIDDLKPFFLKMAEARKAQLAVLASADKNAKKGI